jgi:hypothetical protein
VPVLGRWGCAGGLSISPDDPSQSQGQIIAKFEEVRRQLREASRDLDEDVVMDVMDCLVGWCSPQVRIPFEAGEFREEER